MLPVQPGNNDLRRLADVRDLVDQLETAVKESCDSASRPLEPGGRDTREVE
jgi:hypothetical protein